MEIFQTQSGMLYHFTFTRNPLSVKLYPDYRLINSAGLSLCQFLTRISGLFIALWGQFATAHGNAQVMPVIPSSLSTSASQLQI
jgi:hypothetical protein